MNKVNRVCLSHMKFIYHMKNEIEHFEQCKIGNTYSLTNKVVQPKS